MMTKPETTTVTLTPEEAYALEYLLGLCFRGPRSIGKDELSGTEYGLLKKVKNKLGK